jgi:hypothetical protein
MKREKGIVEIRIFEVLKPKIKSVCILCEKVIGGLLLRINISN